MLATIGAIETTSILSMSSHSEGSGNVFVTGSSYGNGSYPDYATIAYSGAGIPLWTNRYNWPGNGGDGAHAVAVDGNGNVFVTGWSSPSIFDIDYATVAYSGDGVPLWTNRYEGPGNGGDIATDVAVGGGERHRVGGQEHRVAGVGLGPEQPFHQRVGLLLLVGAGLEA